MAIFRASIDTGLPEWPPDKLSPEIHRELIAIYKAFKNLQVGIDKLAVGPATYDVTATYGQLINIYDSGGSHARLASGAAATVRPTVGICCNPNGIISGDIGDVQFQGLIQGLTGIVPGTIYYTSAVTPGAMATSVAAIAGNIQQPIGVGVSTTAIFFNPSMIY